MKVGFLFLGHVWLLECLREIRRAGKLRGNETAEKILSCLGTMKRGVHILPNFLPFFLGKQFLLFYFFSFLQSYICDFRKETNKRNSFSLIEGKKISHSIIHQEPNIGLIN